MAVPTDRIKGRLRAKYPTANLSTKRLDEYAAKLAPKPADDADDAAIDAILEEANGLIDFVGVAREDDRVRNLETLAAKVKLDEPPAPPAPTEAKPGDETNTLLRTLTEAVTKLTGDVTALKDGKVLDQKKQTALQAIESSEIFKKLTPEQRQKWSDRIDLTSETSFDDQVKAFETELTDLRQSTADSGNYAGAPPASAGGKGEPSDKELDAIVSNL